MKLLQSMSWRYVLVPSGHPALRKLTSILFMLQEPVAVLPPVGVFVSRVSFLAPFQAADAMLFAQPVVQQSKSYSNEEGDDDDDDDGDDDLSKYDLDAAEATVAAAAPPVRSHCISNSFSCAR